MQVVFVILLPSPGLVGLGYKKADTLGGRSEKSRDASRYLAGLVQGVHCTEACEVCLRRVPIRGSELISCFRRAFPVTREGCDDKSQLVVKGWPED